MRTVTALGGERRGSGRLDESRLDAVRRHADPRPAPAGTRVGADGAAHVVVEGLDAGRVVRVDDRPLVLRGDAMIVRLTQAALDRLLDGQR